MRVELDAKVRTHDGQDAGTVRRAVWDPERNEISEFVVNTGGLFGHDVLIGRAVLESASRDGDVIVIDMGRDELRAQRPYDEGRYTIPPEGWLAPVTYGYAMQSYVWPLAAPRTETQASPRGSERPTLESGMLVKDADGHTIGEVREVDFDEASGTLRSVVIRRGRALDRLTGRGDDLRIGVDELDIGDGAVHLVGEEHSRRT